MGKLLQTVTASLVPIQRRREIARMLNAGLLQDVAVREIPELLAARGFVNPLTGRPWVHNTIHQDLKSIKRSLIEESKEDVLAHKASLLASLRDLYRKATEADDRKEARLVLGDIAKLLGANAPEVFVFEETERRMTEALRALREEFRLEPEIWNRITGVFARLDGSPAAPRADRSEPRISN